MTTYNLTNPKQIYAGLGWLLLFMALPIIASRPPLYVVALGLPAAVAIPVFLAALQLGSYAIIHDDTLTVVYGFVFRKSVPISNIQSIQRRKVFKLGETTALLITYKDQGRDRKIFATGVFTDDLVRQKLGAHLLKMNPKIVPGQASV